MEIHLGDRDEQSDCRNLALRFKRREKSVVRKDAAGAVDAQCLIETGPEEDQPEPRLTYDIGEAIDAPVAGPVRDDERSVVTQGDETRRIAAWACIVSTAPVGNPRIEEC